MVDKLFDNHDQAALQTCMGSNQTRKLSNYSSTDKWGTFFTSFSNPFMDDIHRLKNVLSRNTLGHCQPFYTTNSMWQTMIKDGVDVNDAVHGDRSQEPAGMKAIRQTMYCIEKLVQYENTKLEPFQLECLRACICSSALRMLGEDLNKYIPDILQVTGIAEREGFDDAREQLDKLNETFQYYARRFVAVVAPRRNGKSKAGKLFVAANAISEPGARIVLVAHQLNAVMLYKSEIMKHLHQMLDMGLGRYKIHSSASEIRIEFLDRPASHIYFVAGGINVSIN